MELTPAENFPTIDQNGADRSCHVLSSEQCFHCHLPIPDDFDVTVTIKDIEQPMCCYGCKAVAEAIIAAGHESFYHLRTEASPTGEALVPEFLAETQVYDNASVQQEFVQQVSDFGVYKTSIRTETTGTDHHFFTRRRFT